MKNVKKLLKKAMVFTVAASMLVGTPLTASAAGIRGVYSVSDGTDTVKENPNDSGTGTVTNTNTESGTSVLENYDAKIIGIVLDQENVNAVAGKPQDLKATVILDGSLEDEEAIQKELASKIRWEVANADGSKDTNPAATVGIKASAADRSVVTLNPKKGTKQGKEILVTATIDRSYYWVEKRDESGNLVVGEDGKPVLEMKNTGIEGEPYTASAKVFVKEYSKKLWFDEAKIKEKLTDGRSQDYTALLKHTVDLSDCLKRDPVTANDTITWISTDTKYATVTAAGVVTFKKVGKGSILAVGEKGVQAEYKFEVEAGQAASRVEIVTADAEKTPLKSKEVNLTGDGTDNCDESESFGVGVKMYAKVKGVIVDKDNSKIAAASPEQFKRKGNDEVVTGNVEVADGTTYYTPDPADKKLGIEHPDFYITDTVTWTSNKKAVADVTGDTDGATITALSVGKAAITAKSSAGKSCKLNVTVTATLTDLVIGNVPENGMYSGQTVTLTALKNPRANKDAVVWSIAKEADGSKNPNATINSKGELKIKPMLNTSKDAYRTVEVELRSKKKYTYNNVTDYIYADKATIELTQSSIDEIYVYDGNDKVASAVAKYKDNGNFNKIVKNEGIAKAANTRTINVPKGKTFDIQAFVAKGFEGISAEEAEGTLSFKSSSTKVATINPAADGRTLTVTANAKGSSTVTVSGVRVNGTKASTISTTFKVNVVQPVKTLTMNKPVVTINEKFKSKALTDQAVSLKVTLGPKGVNTKEAIKWEVKQTKAEGVTVADAKYTPAKDSKNKDITKASASVKLPTPKVGDQFVIKASTKSGATATATVNVVTKTTAVAIAQSNTLKSDKTPDIFMDGSKKNTRTAKIGEEFKLYPFINVGKSSKAADIDWRATNENGVFTEDSKNIEGVTYSVNKKGVVNIDADGTVHVINKGTVTITAKTPQGKKGTVKVVVKDLTLFGASEN